MPKQKRWELKRLVDHSVNDVDRAQGNLLTLKSTFEHVHPEIASTLEAIMVGLELTKDALLKFKDSF